MGKRENLGHGFEELRQAGGFKLCRWLDLILKTQLEKTHKKIHLLLDISFKETKKLYFFSKKNLFPPVAADRASRGGDHATSKNEYF